MTPCAKASEISRLNAAGQSASATVNSQRQVNSQSNPNDHFNWRLHPLARLA